MPQNLSSFFTAVLVMLIASSTFADPPKVRPDLQIEDLGAPIKRRELHGMHFYADAKGVHHVFFQVAAFNDPDRARRFEQSLLASVNEVIEIVPVQVSGRTWNRVYVGRFASRLEAESAAEGIAPLTGTDAAVFIRPRS